MRITLEFRQGRQDLIGVFQNFLDNLDIGNDETYVSDQQKDSNNDLGDGSTSYEIGCNDYDFVFYLNKKYKFLKWHSNRQVKLQDEDGNIIHPSPNSCKFFRKNAQLRKEQNNNNNRDEIKTNNYPKKN